MALLELWRFNALQDHLQGGFRYKAPSARKVVSLGIEYRLAFERLVKDQLEALADPDAPARFRRTERFARREYNQNYWWRPGQVVPE